MAFQDVGIRLVVLGTGQFERDVLRASTAMSRLNRDLASSGGPLSSLGTRISNLGTTFLQFGSALTLGVTIPLAYMTSNLITAGIDFETAFTGVGKTVDGVMDNFGNLTAEGKILEQGIRDLSLTIPIAADELANVTQIAGQLGVRGTENLLKFTETAAKLAIATDFTASEAATNFAKLGNIMGVEAEKMGEFISRAGNATVELGNNFAATEPEILKMTLRLAGAANAAGLTTPQILGIGTAMVAMGIQSEMGGSAVSRIFLEMQSAVNSGGSELEAFAKVVGLTQTEFKDLFRNDPTQLFLLLLDSFADLNKEGKLTNSILEDLNLDTIRTQDVMNRLGPNVDLVKEAIASANKEWTDQNALQNEFSKFASTTSAKIQILRNNISNLGITIFKILSPAINGVISTLTEFISGFNESIQTSEDFRNRVFKLTGALLLLGPALTIMGIALKGIAAFIGTFNVFGNILGVITSPTLLAGIGILVVALTGINSIIEPLKDRFNELIAIKRIMGDWDDSSVTFIDKLKVGIEALGDVVPIIGTVTDIISNLISNLSTAFQFTNVDLNLGAAFDDLLSGDIFGAIDNFKLAWGDFTFWFVNFGIPAITDALPDDVVTVLDKIVGWFVNLEKGISGFLSEVGKTDPKAVENILTAIATGLGVLAEVASTSLALGLPVIGIGIRIITEAIGDLAAGNAGDALDTIVDGIKELSEQPIEAIAASIVVLALAMQIPMVSGAVAATASTLAFAASLAVTLVTGVASGVVAIGSMVIAFGTYVAAAGAAIGATIVALAPILALIAAIGLLVVIIYKNKDALSSWLWVFEAIYIVIKEVVGRVIDFLTNTDFFGLGKDIINGIWNGVKWVWGSFKGWIIEKFNEFVDWVLGFLGIHSPSTKFFDIGKDLIQGLWDGMVNLWQAFIDWVYSKARAIVDKFTSIITDIYAFGKNIVVLIQGGIQWGWDTFIEWVRTKASAIKTKFQETADSMIDIGKAIVDGLEKGISDNWEAFKTWVGGLFAQIPYLAEVINWISSPSKRFAKIGEQLVQGLQVGMEDAWPILTRSFTGMMKDMRTDISLQSDGLSGAMLGAATGNTITTNNMPVANNTNTSTFAPTINGVPMQDEASAGREMLRAYRMAQIVGNI